MNAPGFRLRGLDFTGPGAPAARIELVDGLNIVYGASNTGKSFIAKTLHFMLGGGRSLPSIDGAAPYTAVLLRLLMPDGAPITLYRAIAGGNYLAYEGLHHARPQDVPGQPLKAIHDPASFDNLSMFLLAAIGLASRPLVKNDHGEKETLSIRRLAPYVIVDETTIISERSPLLSGQHILDTVERNVLRLVLTGRDDAAVVPTLKPRLRDARVSGQIDLVDEWIARIDAELGDDGPSREELGKQSEKLDRTLSDHEAGLRQRQERIDELVKERRIVIDRQHETSVRRSEIEVTLGRFRTLDAVFVSDVERLVALEEGGSLLLAISGRPCPLCGADPDHQRHRHGAEEVRGTRAAARAETDRIRKDRRDLRATMTVLETDAVGSIRTSDRLGEQLRDVEHELSELRPKEAELKAEYERLLATRDGVRRTMDHYAERDRLIVRRSQLDTRVSRQKKAGKVAKGIDSTTAFKFAQSIEAVLRGWQFPGSPKVSFDLASYDIQVNGKARDANGKGVRAILHAAIKVALLVHCRENGLPHPGFVVLDTPLLTYREPMRDPKHGSLAPDEVALKNTKLDEHFYAHLHGIREYGQFLILENADPPPSAVEKAMVTAFSGGEGEGRYGLFPVDGARGTRRDP